MTTVRRRKAAGLCQRCGIHSGTKAYCLECAESERGRHHRLKEYVNNLKANPCADCKQVFQPWQMDFDHRDGVTKVREVSHLSSTKAIDLEVLKCDLVCANCHRQRTHDRSNKAKPVLATTV